MNVECQTCGASLVLEAAERTAVCPYCASPSVVERPPAPGRPVPVFGLGFVLTRDAASLAVRDWLGRRGWFVRSGVKSGSIDSIRGVYVPAYLYTAMAQTAYRAEIGEDYQETETYTETDSQGNTVTRTRTVTRTEYRSLAGQHAGYVMDVLVTASRSLPNAELEAIEPFDLRMIRRYSPALLSGWTAEEPTLDPAQCAALARQETLEKIGQELASFMPGDSHTGLWFQTALDRESADLIYVPVWVLAVRYDAKRPPFRMVINGQTGAIHGKAPLSWLKILLAVLIVLALIATPFVVAALTGGSGRSSRSTSSATPSAVEPAASVPSATAAAPSTSPTAPSHAPTTTGTRTAPATTTATTTASKTGTKTAPATTTGKTGGKVK